MRIFTPILALSLAFPALAGPTHPDEGRLAKVHHAKVVVVQGSADHMDRVLRRAGTEFVVVSPEELPELPLHSEQVLMVNCRGVMSERARDRVRRFVAAGGFLYTTDHAVHELVEKIFPRTIRWNRKSTNEQVFPMQTSGDQGLLSQIDNGARWQVAGGGYLFDVVDPKRVEVLMRSKQVAKRYGGDGTLGVRFRYEDGQVIHVTGHFYSQPGLGGGGVAMKNGNSSFEQLTDNVVQSKAQDKSRLDRIYNKRSSREVILQAEPTADAKPVAPRKVTKQKLKKKARLKVLEKKGDFSRVRDDEGNEGWVPAEAVE
jgi:hypothetical protein